MVEENQQPGPDGLEHPSVRYETSDASFRWVVGIMVVFLVIAGVTFFAVQRFYWSYAAYEARVKGSQYPLATDNGRLPPEPRLEQINRLANVEKGNVFLREESKEPVLTCYRSIEGEDQYVHVPIDRAMDYLARENRLPAREAPPGDASKKQSGLVDGGGPNSGRLLREKAPWYEP